MAQLGSINLFYDSILIGTSGAAFTLTSPSRTSTVHIIEGAEVELHEGQRDVVVRFKGSKTASESFEKGRCFAQDGLDMLSILGRFDASIQDAENEHIVWWSEDSGIVLRVVSTAILRISVGSPSIVVQDKDGNVIPIKTEKLSYHIGFRYYRLAQTTDDLFDAFRNMYLSFEALLSSQYPKKTREQEIVWLERALTMSCRILKLEELVSAESTTVVKSIIQSVYKEARLPLFHAKYGEDHYAPQRSLEDRKIVSKALGLLTEIVLRMASTWYGVCRSRGGVFYSWIYDNAKSLLNECSVIATNNFESVDLSEKNLSHERFQTAVKFETQLLPKLEKRQTLVIFATSSGKILESIGNIWKIEVVTSGKPIMVHVFETPLTCDKVNRVEVLIHFKAENGNPPKSTYKR